MQIKLVAYLIAIAIVTVLAYAVAAFGAWDLNPENWPWVLRLAMGAAPVYFALKTFDQVVVDE